MPTRSCVFSFGRGYDELFFGVAQTYSTCGQGLGLKVLLVNAMNDVELIVVRFTSLMILCRRTCCKP